MLYLLVIVGLAQLLALSSLCEAAAHPLFSGGRDRNDPPEAFSRLRSDRAELAAMMQVYYDDPKTGGTEKRRDGRLFLSIINDIRDDQLVRQSLCSAVIKSFEELSQQVEVRNISLFR